MPSPTTPTHMKPKWLIQTLEDAQEHLCVLEYLVRVSIPLWRYATHLSLDSFICESSNCIKEVSCDSLIEDDVWVEPETTTCIDL